jgi:membrane protease YdiL (CAAX protease family)
MTMERIKAFVRFIRSYNPATAIVVTIGGFYASQVFGVIAFLIYAAITNTPVDSLSDKITESVILTLLFSIAVYGFYLAIIRSFLTMNKLGVKDIGLKQTNPAWETVAYSLAAYGFYFVLTIVSTILIKTLLPAVNLDQKQEISFDPYTSGLSLVVLPPVVEEIAMRGFLYTGLRKKLNFFWAGLVTSIIFGLAHLQWESSAPLLWAAAIDTFLLSWILIILREKTGSLYASIGLHMIKNFMAFLALFIFHVA